MNFLWGWMNPADEPSQQPVVPWYQAFNFIAPDIQAILVFAGEEGSERGIPTSVRTGEEIVFRMKAMSAVGGAEINRSVYGTWEAELFDTDGNSSPFQASGRYQISEFGELEEFKLAAPVPGRYRLDVRVDKSCHVPGFPRDFVILDADGKEPPPIDIASIRQSMLMKISGEISREDLEDDDDDDDLEVVASEPLPAADTVPPVDLDVTVGRTMQPPAPSSIPAAQPQEPSASESLPTTPTHSIPQPVQADSVPAPSEPKIEVPARDFWNDVADFFVKFPPVPHLVNSLPVQTTTRPETPPPPFPRPRAPPGAFTFSDPPAPDLSTPPGPAPATNPIPSLPTPARVPTPTMTPVVSQPAIVPVLLAPAPASPQTPPPSPVSAPAPSPVPAPVPAPAPSTPPPSLSPSPSPSPSPAPSPAPSLASAPSGPLGLSVLAVDGRVQTMLEKDRQILLADVDTVHPDLRELLLFCHEMLGPASNEATNYQANYLFDKLAKSHPTMAVLNRIDLMRKEFAKRLNGPRVPFLATHVITEFKVIDKALKAETIELGNILAERAVAMLVSHNRRFLWADSAKSFQVALLGKLSAEDKKSVLDQTVPYGKAGRSVADLKVTELRSSPNANVEFLIHVCTHRKGAGLAQAIGDAKAAVTAALRQCEKLRFPSVLVPSVVSTLTGQKLASTQTSTQQMQSAVFEACAQFVTTRPKYLKLITLVEYKLK